MPQIMKNMISSITLESSSYISISKKRYEHLEFIEKNYADIINLGVLISEMKEKQEKLEK